jgi:hypothetical protein
MGAETKRTVSRDGVACQERARGSRITGPTHQEARRQHPLAGGRSCTAVAARQNGPDDLAAGLNPHKPELTPIEQSRRLAVRDDQRRFRAWASPIARQPANAESAGRLRSAVPVTLRERHVPSLRTRTRLAMRGTST